MHRSNRVRRDVGESPGGDEDREPESARSKAATTRRLFAIYAVVSLVPVVVLGLVLLRLLRRRATPKGSPKARAAPPWSNEPRSPRCSDGQRPAAGADPDRAAGPRRQRQPDRAERSGRAAAAARSRRQGRLRLRGGRLGEPADDDEALEAARGKTVAELTYLNSDDDAGAARSRARRSSRSTSRWSAQTGTRIGVVELYLPYAPIAADIADGQSAVTVVLSLGLLAVWAALLAVSVSVTRRLRREARLNAVLANNDLLTGLPNRSRFVELINDRMTTADAARGKPWSPCSTSTGSRRSTTRSATTTATG